MIRALQPPLLICIDFQREYVASGRPLCIEHAASLLATASRLLQGARSNGWLVAHTMLLREDVLFGAHTEHARPLPGFEPLGSEMVFRRDTLSVYGNTDFGRLLLRSRGLTALAMALGPFSILPAAFDAYAKHDDLVFIEDVVGASDVSGSRADSVASVTKSLLRSMHRTTVSDVILGAGNWEAAPLSPPARLLIRGEA